MKINIFNQNSMCLTRKPDSNGHPQLLEIYISKGDESPIPSKHTTSTRRHYDATALHVYCEKPSATRRYSNNGLVIGLSMHYMFFPIEHAFGELGRRSSTRITLWNFASVN